MTFNLSPQNHKGRLLLKILLISFGIFFQIQSSAQTITRTVGTGGNYGTLKAAFDAINTGALRGEITLQIISSLTTETTTATLNATGSGDASYSSVTIYPTVSNCVISGNLAAPLIDLNGASNIIIDGRVNRTGSNVSLTINNTNTSATAGTSTIRFINGASNNTIQYCLLRGATTNTGSGIVFFSTSTAATGNHTNTITNNNITSSTDANRPVNAIYSEGTSALLRNLSITISNNLFYNFLNRSIESFGIHLNNFTHSATITGNSFYETATFVSTANVNYTIIQLNHLGSGGHIVSQNFIGGSSANCTGTWTKSSSTGNSFTGIYANCSSAENNIHGNVIRGWSWTNSNTTANLSFYGMRLNQGTFNVGALNNGNVIGNSTGNGSISLSSSAATFYFYGIMSNGATINVGYNTIGSITANNTDPAWGTMYVEGIRTASGSGTIHNNLIGSSTTSNSINANSTCTSNYQDVFGINITGGGFVISKNTIANIRNGTTSGFTNNTGRINGISLTSGSEVVDNTIFNLTIANANSSTSENASITGICCRSTSASKKIWRNTIYNLSNTHASFTGNVTGIYGSTSSGVSTDINSNFIYGLSVTGASSTTARIYGINLVQGVNTCYNNVIHLGGNTRTEIFGISETGASGNNNNIFFNTVYLSGTAPSGATNRSYALYSSASTNIRDFRNNILFNARSTTSGSNLHYAIFYNYSVNTNLTTNYNDYLATGTGGAIGYYAGSSRTLATLRSAIGQDAGSLSVNPVFANPGGTTATDYKPETKTLAGISLAAVNHDFVGSTRQSTPMMGAFELESYLVEIWKNDILQASYVTLKAAFDEINAGTHHGTLQIRIKGSLWETETCVLNAPTGFASMYDQIEIFPTIDGVQIRGNFAGPMIDFDGASKIAIDGRPNKTGTTGKLSIINESTSGNSNTSTIRFINDANRIIVQHTTIAGSQTASQSGVVFVGTSTGTEGNDDITFDYCDFTTSNATTRPRTMIYSVGSIGKINDNLTISNSNIYDFLNTFTQASGSVSAYGFLIGNYTSGTSIVNNSFYERNTFNCTGSGGTYAIIQLTGGSNINIQGNYIGGTAALCQGGNFTKTGDNKAFYGIYVSGTPTGTNNFVQDNTISKISWTNTGNANFVGISGGAADAGLLTIRNNTIGASTGTNAIVFNAGATGAIFYGIYSFGPMLVDGNRIGGITASNISTGATHIYGIHKHTGNSNYYNNLVGSLTTANSINSTSQSTSAAQNVIGINISNSASSVIIDNNTIANLTNGTTNITKETTGLINGIAVVANPRATITNNKIFNLTIGNANISSTHLASAAGIVINNSSTQHTIANNTIYNIHNNYDAFEGSVHGIYFTGIGTQASHVRENFIYNLRINGSAASKSAVIGIRSLNGNTTYSNNVISLGNNCTSQVIGFLDHGTASNPCNLYFNTIYVNGTVSGSLSKSMALYSPSAGNIRNYRNNIFFNARSSDATGQHYAVFYEYSSTSNLTVNYNNYRVTGTGGILAGFAGADINSLSELRTAIGQDQFSLDINPVLANPGGFEASDYKPLSDKLIGAGSTGITIDYEGITRSNPPTIGAFEGNLFLYVEVWESGVYKKSYLTLRDAFDKINEGVHQGTLEIKINTSTTEPATAALYQSGYSGLSNYNSVHIYPTVSGLSISGSFIQLIELNGADNVTLDGRVNATGNTKDLTIVNNLTSSTPSTIRLVNDASDNTIKYCILRGGGTSSQGVVSISNTNATTGNINNTVEHNTITGISDTSRPSTGLLSSGTSGKENQNLIVRNNHFVNLMNAGVNTTVINFSTATTASSIINNSIFETAVFTPSSLTTVTGINVSGGTNIIRENFIGGSTSGCAGTALTKADSNSNTFNGIQVSAATGAFTEIDGNKISNIVWNNTANHVFTGISITGGDVKVGSNSGNIIGSSLAANSIVYSGATTDANLYGINITSTGVVECSGNYIGGIRTSNLAANASNIHGIRITGGTGQKTISGNTIGSTSIESSIIASSNSSSQSQFVYGISNSGNAIINIENNTIANLTNGTNSSSTTVYGLVSGIYTTIGTNTVNNNEVYNLTIANNNSLSSVAASASGIAFSGTGVNIARGNTIYNITNTNENFSGHISGLFFTGSTTPNEVSRNFIFNIGVTGATSTSASIYGIRAASGVTTYSNNIVHIGGNSNSILYGIHDFGSSNQHCTLYNNTILISGTSPEGSSNKSYALFSYAANNTKNYRNNILFNARSTSGGSNLHYAISITATGNLTSDYNDLYVSGTGGTIGFFSTNRLTLSDWRTGTIRDLNSYSFDPKFANQGGYVPEDYIPENTRLVGATGTGVTTDFAGAARSTIPTIGAYEIILDLYVQVWKTGIMQAQYLTLKAAFDDINNGTHTGALDIRINENTTETASAVLNASGSGSAVYNSVLIYPTRSGLSVTGNLTSPLIDMNGADNVTIDGRVNAMGDERDLTIANLQTSTTVSTIRFYNDASNNTIRYCNLKGASITAGSQGIVSFTTGASTGNINNTIDNNNFTGLSATQRHIIGVLSVGSSAAVSNRNLTISNNHFYDLSHRGANSWNVYLSSHTTECTVTGNSFFETGTFVPTANATYTAIDVRNTAGVNYTISNNFIGGSAPNCTGMFNTNTTTSNSFYGIYLNPGTSIYSNVHGNTITNMNWISTGSTASYWVGIMVERGNANVGTLAGNTIGSSTGNDAIRVRFATNNSEVYAYSLLAWATGTMNFENNTAGSVTISSSSTANAINFYGIISGFGTVNIINNLIGSTTTPNSIQSSSTSTTNAQLMYGMRNNSSGTVQIRNNTIANLTNGTTNANTGTQGLINGITTTAGTNSILENTIFNLSIANANVNATHTASIGGIVLSGTAASTINTVSRNTIHSLNNGFVNFFGHIRGIYFTGNASTANVCSRNFIHSLSASSSHGAFISAIRAQSGSTTYSNNIVNIGDNSGNTFYGFYDVGAASQSCNLYHNTIYIGGQPTYGSNNCAALWSNANSNNRNYRNNIFSNARSNNGATGKHYAAYYNYGTATNLTNNNNDYYSSGTGGVPGYYNGIDLISLAEIKAAIGQDTGSKSDDPGFANEGGTTYSDYLPSNYLPGAPDTGVSIDYTGAERAGAQSMGALIYSVSVTINSHPVSQTGCEGSEITFSIDAGNADSYQWRKNGNIIIGATSSTLTIENISTGDADNYSCDVINIFGSLSSEVAVLTVRFVPAQPSTITGSSNVYHDSNGHIYSITNVAGVSYAWLYSGTGATIIGTGNSITINFAPGATSGTLSVTPSNDCGNGLARTLDINISYYNVEVWKLSSYQQGYTTLKGAFDAINAGTHTGTLDVKINNNTTESSSASLNASGSGSASYTSIVIYPTTSGLSVSGNLAAPLINLNGAKNITIDGRENLDPEKPRELTIINNNTSTTVGTSLICFINDASNNTLQYCIIKSAQQAYGCGTIFFSTTTGTTGNDNNTIQYNHFTGINNNDRPAYTIYSAGTASKDNNNITIHQNHFFNYLGRGTISYAIYLTANTSTCTVTSNHFYQPTTLVPTAANAYGAIIIDNASGTGFVVNDNIIGGTTSNAGGGKWTNNSTFTNSFWALFLKVGTSAPSNIQGNTIRNFNWTSLGASQWNGIVVAGGNVNIGTSSGNTVGSDLEAESIIVNFNHNSSEVYPLSSTSTGNINIHNNIVGGIATNNSNSTLAASIYALSVWSGISSIQNNTIGSNTIANSIVTKSASTSNAQRLYGIYTTGTSTTISGNQVANLTNLSTNSNASHAGVVGGIYNGAANCEISNNTINALRASNANNFATDRASVTGIVNVNTGTANIHNNNIRELTNTQSSFSGFIYGVYTSSGTANNSLINNNIVSKLNITGASATTGNICGIRAFAGKSIFYNNIVILDGTSRTNIYGLYDTGSAGNTTTFSFNTVYIGGNVASGSNRSYALYSLAANNTRDFRNNLLYNERSTNGGTNLHTAIFLNYSTTSLLTINHNNYYSTGIGSVLGFLSSNINSLQEWRNATGQDQYSTAVNPRFSNPGGYLADDYIPSATKIKGNSNVLITTDYNDNPRPLIPTMGALERILNKWKGSLNTNWGTDENWTRGYVPETDDDIYFDESPLNHCILDINRSIGYIFNEQATYRAVANGLKLTIKGNIEFQNGAQIDASASGSTLEFAGEDNQLIPAGSMLNNQIFNLLINNANDVTLQGTLNLLNTLTATSGRLNAMMHSPTLMYGGVTTQTIEDGVFTGDQIFNLIIDNSAGVTLNSTLEVVNDMVINAGKVFNIAPDKKLKVGATLTNNAGANNFIIHSSDAGTGSLIHNTNNVPATVQRHIGGPASGWHFLSAPLTNQAISGSWKPSGTYGDGTGYDLYVWDEPNSCWIYNLNNSVAPTWSTVHPQNSFVAGRGYLYALQESNTTKTFSGNLNNGNQTINLTTSATTTFQGFNLVGNPYPSSIDWKLSTGYSRNILQSNGGGYDIWVWNPVANNYGVYNSANDGDTGTNGIGRYLAPMQGFFVQAASAGNMIIYNNARNHTDASNWKIKQQSDFPDKKIKISIESKEGFGSDEIELSFGNYNDDTGSRKLFSHVESAPSLFLRKQNKEYSTLRIKNQNLTAEIDLYFKPGSKGTYTLSKNADENLAEVIILEDLLTGKLHDLKSDAVYEFNAIPGQLEKRFSIRFKGDYSDNEEKIKANVYVVENYIVLDLKKLSGRYYATTSDTSGKLIDKRQIIGGKETTIPMESKGLYIIQIISEETNRADIYKTIF